MIETKQFCTFYLGTRLIGIEVLKIQEVIRFQEVTEVPLAPGVIRGLLNLRGSIVTTIDLRQRFGMSPLEAEAQPANVVTQTPGGLVSLLVDRIGDVVEVDHASLERPPDTLQDEARDLTTGVYQLPAGLLMVLNLERVLDIDSVLS